MAELLLKVGNTSNHPVAFRDGDILCAFNRRRIRHVHAQHICHPRSAKRNASGLILLTEPARDWCEQMKQYRFRRVSAKEVERTDLITGETEVFSDRPNERGEAIDVRLYVARRRAESLKHCLFGEDGAEMWYGGSTRRSYAALDAVWNAIETKTPHREANYRRWPAGEQELRSHLFISVDDFDDEEAERLVAPEIDDSDPARPVILQQRQHRVDWRTRLQLTARERAEIEDPAVRVDIREKPPLPRLTAIEVKASRRVINPAAP